MATIPLVGVPLVALVDDSDLHLSAQYTWYLIDGYAKTSFHRAGCSRTDPNRTVNLSLHRLIMDAQPGQYVDHINRDRLDNRRVNLRLVTRQQNAWNTSKHTDSKSEFLGVRQESENVFSARLDRVAVGYYRTAVEAAQARDLAALAERGEFAVLNFPAASLPSSVEALPLRNTGPRTSNVRGVSYAANRKAQQKWRVVLKKKHLGWFETEQEAIAFVEGIK